MSRLERAIATPTKSWTWTCLPCNVTGTGDRRKHTCSPAAPAYLRDHWIRRITSTNLAITQEQAAALIAQPVDRSQMIEWFGWQWEDRYCACGAQAVLPTTPFEHGRPEHVQCSNCAKPKEGA